MDLARRPLGTSGLRITTVGFGAWAIGGGGWAFGWGPQDDRRLDRRDPPRGGARRQLDRHRGGRTASATRRRWSRGPWRAVSEPPPSSSPSAAWSGTTRRTMRPAALNLRPDAIRRECEASLRRLGVERIDLYQFHWPDRRPARPSRSRGARWPTSSSRARCAAAGLSNFDVPLLERCEPIRHVDSPAAVLQRDRPRGGPTTCCPGARPTGPA